MTRHDNQKDTPETLRRDIDAGRGRDKIAAPDPAAAPLGTDDEAAGTPISLEQARSARSNEIHTAGGHTDVPPAMTGAADPETAAPARHRTGSAFGSAAPMLWVIGVLVAALAFWLLVRLFG